MHPVIGNFISEAFYDGGITNGEKTVNHINDYHVFDNKNVVWVNVPLYAGFEEKSGNSSLERESEVNKIIDIV